MNENANPVSSESQCRRILKHLLAGRTVTPLEALKKFKSLRLAARISDLKDKGHNIDKTMVDTPSGKRVAQYFYVKDDDKK